VITALVLAAGASTRMGRHKLLLPVGDSTLLGAAVHPLLASTLDEVVVVLGCEAAAVREAAGLPETPRLRFALNPDWADGMAASLRCGLQECAGADAALVALGDQPGIAAAPLEALLAAARNGAPLALPVHDGRAGHPVVFARELFGELLSLEGDVGGREVVRRHWSRAVCVPALPLPDVDSDADYRALLLGRARRDAGMALPPR
jgi:molybdenum cofactor cytidylyltransferase